MIDKNTLKISIKNILDKNSIESTLILARQDGVVVFEQDNILNESSKQSVGALMAGAWQASNAITSFFPKKESSVFRLGFDTSDSGMYMLPVETATERFFIGLFYFNEINPAILKNKLRKVSVEILDELKIYFDAREEMNKPLFEDITDEEIDNIFTFAGV